MLLERCSGMGICVYLTERAIFKVFSGHIVYDIVKAVKDNLAIMTVRPWCQFSYELPIHC